jgi:hypothetical protein
MILFRVLEGSKWTFLVFHKLCITFGILYVGTILLFSIAKIVLVTKHQTLQWRALSRWAKIRHYKGPIWQLPHKACQWKSQARAPMKSAKLILHDVARYKNKH